MTILTYSLFRKYTATLKNNYEKEAVYLAMVFWERFTTKHMSATYVRQDAENACLDFLMATAASIEYMNSLNVYL